MKIKILVIGELGVDRFVYGNINRLCPEAPVPVLNPTEIVENEGMAGNVVSNIKALLPEDKYEVVFWHQSNPITKTRFVHNKTNHMIMRLDEGEDQSINNIGFLSPSQRETISQSDIVIISDYNKGYLDFSSIEQILSLAKLSIIDTKKTLQPNKVKHSTFIKLNEVEWLKNFGIENDLVGQVLITLGAKGVKYLNEIYPSPNPQDTIDVSGAGDTFTAAFILKFYLSRDIPEAIRFANKVCANVVNKKGVAIPDIEFQSELFN